MRALGTGLVLLLAACTSAPRAAEPTPLPTHETDTLDVSVLLDLSGLRSSIGAAQRNAMQLWLDQKPSRSGLATRAKFVDLASSDARLLVELRRAVVEDRADAVVIGAPIQYDATFAQALDVARVPVLLTLPAPEPMTDPAGRWAFALAPTYTDVARLEVADASARGVLGPTLLVSDETPAAIAERIAFGRELERRGLVRPTVVMVTAQDAAQRIRPGASVARSIHFAGAASTYIDAIRSVFSLAATPHVYLSYLTETADLTDVRGAAPMYQWPGSRHLVLTDAGSSASPRLSFWQPFVERYGAPSTVAATAYDALTMLDAAAAPMAKAFDRERLRERLEAVTVAGICSRYTFSSTRHAGFAVDDLAYLRWSTAGVRAGPALAIEPALR